MNIENIKKNKIKKKNSGMKLILPNGMAYSYMPGWFWPLGSPPKRNEPLDVAFFYSKCRDKKMKRSIRLEETFKVSPETLYNAWVDSTKHTEMTGGKAICSNVINGAFSAWDEYPMIIPLNFS
jgi:hypothetical protein